MTLEENSATIRWRLHLQSPPAKVYELLATEEGRAGFWAESAVERAGSIEFIFSSGFRWSAKILERRPARRFRLEYIGGTLATFELNEDGAGGTDLTLTDENVPPAERAGTAAGWVSVLLALKAMADFGVDLRNHDPRRTWDRGYADN